MTRNKMVAYRMRELAEVWRKTPRDYRSRIEGEAYVMVLREGGTHLVPLKELTTEEIARKLGR